MSYTATVVKDLSLTTPTEGSTLPSELNDSDREIKTVLSNLFALQAKTADYTVLLTDSIVICTPTSVDITLTLPPAANCASSSYGKILYIRNYGTYDVVVDGNASETIDGSTTFTMRPATSLILVCNGTMWYSIRPQPKFRGARVYSSADLTVGSSEYEVLWDSESYDTDSIHSTSVETGRLTVPSGVQYVKVLAHIEIRDYESNDDMFIKLYKNDVEIQREFLSIDGVREHGNFTINLDSGVE